MNTYKIIADTSCDIPASVFAEKNVTYVPFNVSFDQHLLKKFVVHNTFAK